MVHKAESEIKRRARLQGTHRLYNMSHIIQDIESMQQAQTLCINIYTRLYIYIHADAI